MMRKTYTIKEFAKLKGQSETYIRHCCNGYTNPSTGRRYSLPPGHTCRKDNETGRTWLIDVVVPDRQGNPAAWKDADGPSPAETRSEFEAVRIEVITKALNNLAADGLSNAEIAKGLIEVLPRMLTNSELAVLISERWLYERPLETAEDLMTYRTRIETGEHRILSNPPPATRVYGLLERLGSCYRGAVRAKKKVSITLDFLQTGEVMVNKTDIKHDAALRRYIEEESSQPPNEFRQLSGLMLEVWKMQLWTKERHRRENTRVPQGSTENILSFPDIANHPKIDELRARCLYCGSLMRDKRKQARFCDDIHKAEHHKMLGRLVGLTRIQQEKALANRLSIVIKDSQIV